MSFRTTYILFGLLIAQIVGFTILQLVGPTPGDDTWVLPKLHRAKLDAKDFKRVEIQRGKEKIVFAREPETKFWRIVEPYQARAEDHVVNQLIMEVKGAPREEMDLVRNLGDYDLDPPQASVTLTRDNGETATLNLGKTSVTQGDRVVFVTSSERPRVPLAVRRNAIEQVFKNPKEYRSPHLLAESSLTIASLKLSDSGHSLVLRKTGDLAWSVDQPPYGEADYDGDQASPAVEKKIISGVRELLSTVEGLRVQYSPEAKVPLDDFVAENVPADELEKKYGLGKMPTTLRIDGEIGIASPFGVRIDPKKEKEDKKVKDALLIGNKADDKGDKYYARLESENNVVRVSARGVDPLVALLKNPSPLRNKDLVKLDDTKIDAIDIQNAGGTIRLRRPRGGMAWKLLEDGTTRDADRQAVQELLNMLTLKRQVYGYPTEPDAELGTDKGTATVSLWENGIVEGKDNKGATELKSEIPNIKLVFGKKNGKLVYVKREAGRDVARLNVSEGLLDRVNEGRYAYFDKTLPSVPADAEVVKLSVVRDGKTYEVVKEKRGDDQPSVWKFTQPPELAGRLAEEFKVRSIIGDMLRLTPDRFVAEKADAAQLAEFKLEPPELKVAITTRKEDKDKKEELKTYDYLFGKTDPNERTYGKQGERDLVFVVHTQALAAARGELVDTKVFSFDAAKIKRIKLVMGKQTLDVARKADMPKEWAVQNALPGFVVDDNRLEILAAELSKLSAERFLAFKDGPKPEHGLSEAERGLFIEFQVEAGDKKDEAKPVTLTIGKHQAPQNGFAAQSSTLPGDVFLMPSMPWELIIKGGIDFFNKDAKKKEEDKKEPAKDDKKEPAKDDKKEPTKKEPAKDDKKEPTKKEPGKDDKKEPAKDDKKEPAKKEPSKQ